MSHKLFFKKVTGAISLLAIAIASYGQTGTHVTGTLSSSGTLGDYYNYSNGSVVLGPGFTASPGSGQSFHAYIFSTDCIPASLNLTSTQNYILTSVPRASGFTTASQLYSSVTDCQVI